jgi:adenylate cyclase
MRDEPARITLRVAITLSIVVVTVATAASLLAVIYFTARDSLAAFTGALIDPLAMLVGEKTNSFLHPVEHAAELSAELVESTGSEPARFDEMESRWYSLLATEPELFYIQYGDRDGNFQLLQRGADGSFATQRIAHHGHAREVTWRERNVGQRRVLRVRRVVDDYDPRVRPWFRGAIAGDGVYWTSVYIHAAEHRPVITAAKRVRRNGRIVGVTSVTIALDRLSQFVRELHIATHGRAFIVDESGHLIAGGARPLGNDARIPSIAEAGSPELVALSRSSAWRAAEAGTPTTVRFTVGHERWLAVIRPFPLRGRSDWLVAVLVPQHDFLAPAQRGLYRSLIVSALIAVFFVGVALLLSRAVGAHLARVVSETEKLERLHFEGGMPSSRFVEIERIYRTFNRLKAGLRAFEKYAPLRLVRMLLESQAEPRLGGRLGTVTILFSDVRGFTSWSERLGPERVAELLGTYFQCLSEIIGELGGTVDKFIGDGVMAFWNAPRADADHALHAVLAALRAREAIAASPQASLLFTRFGVHTSEVMIGNFGARDRFAYTLLGDGVNLASRLEGANKEYGTQILVSGETARAVGEVVLCRHVDRVAVKGKSLATDVFEPICRRDEATDDDQQLVQRYEAALACYIAGDLAEATRRFGAVLEHFPDDGPTSTLLHRCQQLNVGPRAHPWQPVHELRVK